MSKDAQLPTDNSYFFSISLHFTLLPVAFYNLGFGNDLMLRLCSLYQNNEINSKVRTVIEIKPYTIIT